MAQRGFLFITIFILFVMAGCKKAVYEENFPVYPGRNFVFKVENNRVIFPTVKDYKNALLWLSDIENNDFAQWQSLTENFVSQYELKKQGVRSNKFVEDELLANLLNESGEIIIAGKLYILDNQTKTVKVFNRNKDVEIFSFNENVLDEKQNTEKSVSYITGKCPEVIYWPSTCNPNWSYFKANRNNKISYKVAYYKYGIYFTLVAKIKKQRNDRSVVLSVYTYGYKIVRKSGYCYRTNFAKSSQTKGNELKLRPYLGIKRLADYKIIGEFNVRDINGSHYLGKKVCPCNPQK